MERVFKNNELKTVAEIAIANGLEVWTFKGSNPSKYINQVFITDGKRICTVEEHYSGVRYGTEHISKMGSGLGSGFGLTDDIDLADVDLINNALNTFIPSWGLRHGGNPDQLRKYSGWDEYLKRNTILTYYRIDGDGQPFEMQALSK